MKSKIIILSLLAIWPAVAFAHQPVLEPKDNPDFKNSGLYFGAVKIPDPVQSSEAVYGAIAAPGEFDLYAFIPESDGEIPVGAVIPIRRSNETFKPVVAIISRTVSGAPQTTFPFPIPEGYQTQTIATENWGNAFFEPFSLERYSKGSEIQLKVTKGEPYFIAVYDPAQQTGDYALALGTKEDFSDASITGLLKTIGQIKSGLTNNIKIPWLDLAGLFLLLAGLIIGLGAVTVIDVHGFLGRHSPYWTAATITAHKVTKPLIWLGTGILIIGSAIFYRNSWLNGVAAFQAILIILLIINGLFLTFKISPLLLAKERAGTADEPLSHKIRNRIAVSFLISFIGWWGMVLLVAWYLLMQQ